MESRLYDSTFSGIAQSAGGIEALLEEFFSFLQRKTDFYTSVEPSVAEALVLKVFREKRELPTATTAKKKKEEVRATDDSFQREQQRLRERPRIEEILDDDANATRTKLPPSSSSSKATEIPTTSVVETKAESGLGNGGVTDRYTWSQSLQAIEVVVPLPKGTTKREIQVKVTKHKLRVGLAGTEALVEGEFHEPVRPDESYWLLDPSIPSVQISVEKLDQMKWWPCILQGHPTIDTQKIVPEESKLSDLDAETRAMVEKMMVDQRRKAAGLPSSEDQEKARMLDKFKQAHPEMDFSGATVNWGGGGGFGPGVV